MPAFFSTLKGLSLQGAAFRLLSVLGLYQGWLLAMAAWNNRIIPTPGMPAADHDPALILLKGSLAGVWQVLALTAALWCAAQIFDDLKARKPFNTTLLKAFWRVGLFLLLAEVPGTVLPVAQVHPDLPLPGLHIYIDYMSVTLCGIAACLMLVAAKAHHMRAELEQFV